MVRIHLPEQNDGAPNIFQSTGTGRGAAPNIFTDGNGRGRRLINRTSPSNGNGRGRALNSLPPSLIVMDQEEV